MENEQLDELLLRVYNGEKDFNESELADLATEFKRFDLIEADDRRWSKTMNTILKIKDKYFKIEWEQGLTENQENGFYSQPIEVSLTQTEKTITINTYNKI